MDDRGDAVSGALADLPPMPYRDAFIGRQVDLDRVHAIDRLSRQPHVKTDHAVALEQASCNRLSKEAAAAGYEHGQTAHF